MAKGCECNRRRDTGIRLVPAAFVGGDHDDGRSVLFIAEMFEDRIAALARHHHIEDDEIGPLLVDEVLPLLAVAGLEHLVALRFEDGADAVGEFVIVVHDQDDFLIGHASLLASVEGHSSN